jgi:hypothetical protein
MIRDFTKSAMSLSWALSLLGLKQAVNMVRPGQQQGGGDLFAPMTQVAVDQLDDSMKGIYRSGDSLQSRAVDMAFAWMNPTSWLNPSQMMRSFTGSCGQQGAGYRQPNAGYAQNGYGDNAGVGQGANGFSQAAAGIGQAISQATAGFTQAVGQATAGIAQSVTGAAGRAPNAGMPGSVPGSVPVSNEGAAAGWGPMPSDS